MARIWSSNAASSPGSAPPFWGSAEQFTCTSTGWTAVDRLPDGALRQKRAEARERHDQQQAEARARHAQQRQEQLDQRRAERQETVQWGTASYFAIAVLVLRSCLR